MLFACSLALTRISYRCVDNLKFNIFYTHIEQRRKMKSKYQIEWYFNRKNEKSSNSNIASKVYVNFVNHENKSHKLNVCAIVVDYYLPSTISPSTFIPNIYSRLVVVFDFNFFFFFRFGARAYKSKDEHTTKKNRKSNKVFLLDLFCGFSSLPLRKTFLARCLFAQTYFFCTLS